jgi:hypothetical protein
MEQLPFLGALAKLQNATIIFVMSVRASLISHGTTWVPLNGFCELLFWGGLLSPSRKFKPLQNRTKIADILHEDIRAFMATFVSGITTGTVDRS